MNGKPIDVSIVLRCEERTQMLVMYHDVGVTLIRGHRDEERMLVIESQENLAFVDHPELVELYFDQAWSAQGLCALAIAACLEGSKDERENAKKAT